MNKFTNPFDPENEGIKIMIENWVKKIQLLNDTSKVIIQEQLCNEPSCMFAETIITTEQGETVKTFIIAKPLTFVRESDVHTMREITHKLKVKHAH